MKEGRKEMCGRWGKTFSFVLFGTEGKKKMMRAARHACFLCHRKRH